MLKYFINILNTNTHTRIQHHRTESNRNEPKRTEAKTMKQENKELLEAVNMHFWRKDDFGVISIAIAPDGVGFERNADETVR